MRVVRNVADTGRTIVCTIHQPAIDIFEVTLCRPSSGKGATSTETPAAMCLMPVLIFTTRRGASRLVAFPLGILRRFCLTDYPSLQAFDTMLLLKRGGETIFNGPLGFQSQNMISYFESIPGAT